MSILEILQRIANERSGLKIGLEQREGYPSTVWLEADLNHRLEYLSEDCIFDTCSKPEKEFLLEYFLAPSAGRDIEPGWDVMLELSKLLSKNGNLTPELSEAAVQRAAENHTLQLYFSYLAVMAGGEALAIKLVDELSEDFRDGLFLACYRLNTPQIFVKLHGCFLRWIQEPTWGSGTGEVWALQRFLTLWKSSGFNASPLLAKFAADFEQRVAERKPVSPWSESANRISPDRRYRAAVVDCSEIAMGGPTSGTLIVSDLTDGKVYARLEGCSPSIVWSNDSGAIAVPQWTRERNQRLHIVSIPSGVVRALDQEFQVLELHFLEDGNLAGIDSPRYMPKVVDLRVDELMEAARGTG